MKYRVIALTFVTTAFTLLMSCAKQPEDVSPAYISPMQYSHYNCGQIRQELERISYRVAELTGRQEDAADRDAAATGVGIVLFWPALFFLAAGDNEEELARLKGEYEAVQKAAIEKECDVADELREAREREEQRKAEEEKEDVADNDDPKPSFN